ncbi:MAG: dihydrofolate reductase [Conexibacter sp.]|nr:dihydrofolate reductase [Conexibacter sp.]
MTVALVVAYSANRVIGRDGGLPWHLPSDMRHFRELTTGATVVMGRKTYESIPERFRPLPGRRNLVLSRSGFAAPGAEVLGSLGEALDAAGGDCFVIGGGATYAEALPLAARVYATEVEGDVDGDTSFPPLDPAAWTCVAEGHRIAENDHAFTIRVYERRS